MQQLNPGSLQRPARGAWPLLETSLVHPGTRLCVWGSNSPLCLLRAGCCRPGRVCGCPSSCGQMPCRISHRMESGGGTARGGRAQQRQGQAWSLSPIGLGALLVSPKGCCGCLGVPACCPSCACRLFACSQEKEAEEGALNGFLNLI